MSMAVWRYLQTRILWFINLLLTPTAPDPGFFDADKRISFFSNDNGNVVLKIIKVNGAICLLSIAETYSVNSGVHNLTFEVCDEIRLPLSRTNRGDIYN